MKKGIIALTMLALATQGAAAADFFSTDQPDEILTFGMRVGVNTANATLGKTDKQLQWNHNGWGAGFTGGIVANINFRDWITIQPGFFYDTRSNNYAYVWDNLIETAQGPATAKYTAVGHTLNYNFTIPVMVCANFNVTNDLKWSLEFGPYLQFGIGKHDEGEVIKGNLAFSYSDGYYKERHRTQFGMKMGTGLLINNHYYAGIHYLAGCTSVYKTSGLSGRTKEWTFTVGYNF